MQNFKDLDQNLSEEQQEQVRNTKHKVESDINIFRSLGYLFEVYIGELEGTFTHLFTDEIKEKK